MRSAEQWRRHYWPLPSQGTEVQRDFIRAVQNDVLDVVLSKIERTWPEADDLLDAIKTLRDCERE